MCVCVCLSLGWFGGVFGFKKRWVQLNKNSTNAAIIRVMWVLKLWVWVKVFQKSLLLIIFARFCEILWKGLCRDMKMKSMRWQSGPYMCSLFSKINKNTFIIWLFGVLENLSCYFECVILDSKTRKWISCKWFNEKSFNWTLQQFYERRLWRMFAGIALVMVVDVICFWLANTCHGFVPLNECVLSVFGKWCSVIKLITTTKKLNLC